MLALETLTVMQDELRNSHNFRLTEEQLARGEARYWAKRAAGISRVRGDGTIRYPENDRQSAAAEWYGAFRLGLKRNDDVYAKHGDGGTDATLKVRSPSGKHKTLGVGFVHLGFLNNNSQCPRMDGNMLLNSDDYRRYNDTHIFIQIRGTYHSGFDLVGWMSATKIFGTKPRDFTHGFKHNMRITALCPMSVLYGLMVSPPPECSDMMTEYVRDKNLWTAENLKTHAAMYGRSPSPLIQISEFEDGRRFVHDGHHRCVATVMAGRMELEDSEYEISKWTYDLYAEVNHKNGWYTPFDPRVHVREADIGGFKAESRERFLADPVAAEEWIRDNPHQYRHDRVCQTVPDLAERLANEVYNESVIA